MLRHFFKKPAAAAAPPMCAVRMQTVGELLTYIRPAFQRALHEHHIESLVQDMEEDWESRGALTVLQSVSIAQLADGTVYVLDGQHRLAAFARFAQRVPELRSQELPVVVYRCASQSEVLYWYQRINHNLPIHPMELELSWSSKVRPFVEYLQQRYRVYLSKSGAPQCPNLHLPNVQTALQQRATELQSENITPEQLIEDLEALQREIERRIPLQLMRDGRIEKCRSKQPDAPCYLGLWRHHEWIDLLLHRRLRGLAWGALDLTDMLSASASGSRRAIPKPIRRQVWAKTNDSRSVVGKCHICEATLDFDDMECAHDLPHCLGGATSVENMWSACRTCNRDMGIRCLADYRESVRRMRGSEAR